MIYVRVLREGAIGWLRTYGAYALVRVCVDQLVHASKIPYPLQNLLIYAYLRIVYRHILLVTRTSTRYEVRGNG